MTISIRGIFIATGMAAVALSGVGLGWWHADDTGRGAPTKSAPPAWKPLAPKLSDSLADSKLLAAKLPFGEPAQIAKVAPVGANPVAAAPPEWRVGGIVTGERSGYLVLLVGEPGQPSYRAETRHIGESLPDGSVVRTIEPTRITVDRQGTIATIKIFAQR